MQALAVSIFEDGPGSLHLQALYKTEDFANQALTGLNITQELEYFITELPDEDWVAKSQAGLPPVKAGRFWVYGEHDEDKIPPDCPWPIKIEAGPAFGTGHHGTTKGCLLIFDDLLNNGLKPDKILDLGCGAGTLAIAAAKALAAPILASDMDQDAVDVTHANARDNQVGDWVEAVLADGFDAPTLRGRTFDLIFANILAGPLMGLAPDISAALNSGGQVILSGILDEQAENVARAFKAQGVEVIPYPSLNGWTSLLGNKSP